MEENYRELLKIHGYISSDESDSETKAELDDEYECYKPPPIIIDPSKHKIIEIAPSQIVPNTDMSYASALKQKSNKNNNIIHATPTNTEAQRKPTKRNRKKKNGNLINAQSCDTNLICGESVPNEKIKETRQNNNCIEEEKQEVPSERNTKLGSDKTDCANKRLQNKCSKEKAETKTKKRRIRGKKKSSSSVVEDNLSQNNNKSEPGFKNCANSGKPLNVITNTDRKLNEHKAKPNKNEVYDNVLMKEIHRNLYLSIVAMSNNLCEFIDNNLTNPPAIVDKTESFIKIISKMGIELLHCFFTICDAINTIASTFPIFDKSSKELPEVNAREYLYHIHTIILNTLTRKDLMKDASKISHPVDRFTFKTLLWILLYFADRLTIITTGKKTKYPLYLTKDLFKANSFFNNNKIPFAKIVKITKDAQTNIVKFFSKQQNKENHLSEISQSENAEKVPKLEDKTLSVKQKEVDSIKSSVSQKPHLPTVKALAENHLEQGIYKSEESQTYLDCIIIADLTQDRQYFYDESYFESNWEKWEHFQSLYFNCELSPSSIQSCVDRMRKRQNKALPGTKPTVSQTQSHSLVTDDLAKSCQRLIVKEIPEVEGNQIKLNPLMIKDLSQNRQYFYDGSYFTSHKKWKNFQSRYCNDVLQSTISSQKFVIDDLKENCRYFYDGSYYQENYESWKKFQNVYCDSVLLVQDSKPTEKNEYFFDKFTHFDEIPEDLIEDRKHFFNFIHDDNNSVVFYASKGSGKKPKTNQLSNSTKFEEKADVKQSPNNLMESTVSSCKIEAPLMLLYDLFDIYFVIASVLFLFLFKSMILWFFGIFYAIICHADVLLFDILLVYLCAFFVIKYE